MSAGKRRPVGSERADWNRVDTPFAMSEGPLIA